MAKEKSPAFQFYTADLQSDANVAVMENRTLGAYLHLLCYCWREKSLPNNIVKLAAMAKEELNIFKKLWPEYIKPCFRLRRGRWIHPRLEKERKKQREFKRRQSENAIKRWTKNGKNVSPPSEPRHSRGNASRGHSQTHALQSSSSSSIKKEIDKEKGRDQGKPQSVPAATAEDILTTQGFLENNPPFKGGEYPVLWLEGLAQTYGMAAVRQVLTEIIAKVQRVPNWKEEKGYKDWRQVIEIFLRVGRSNAHNKKKMGGIMDSILAKKGIHAA